jgi:hypothetical protein
MTVIIGVVILASLFVYAVLIELIKKQFAPFAGFAPMHDDQLTTMRYVLLGVVAVEFFAIRLVSRLMLSSKTADQRSQNVAQFSTDAQKLMTAAIVTYALCESVAIYGLVLFMIQGKSMDFYLFLLISLFYFGIFFPRYSAWEEWMKERRNPIRGQ